MPKSTMGTEHISCVSVICLLSTEGCNFHTETFMHCPLSFPFFSWQQLSVNTPTATVSLCRHFITIVPPPRYITIRARSVAISREPALLILSLLKFDYGTFACLMSYSLTSRNLAATPSLPSLSAANTKYMPLAQRFPEVRQPFHV